MGYPTRAGRKPAPNIAAQGERLQALVGDRGRDEGQKAVTRADAAAMGAIALRSTYVTAAPTADQHNALVDDLRALAGVLNSMGARITGL